MTKGFTPIEVLTCTGLAALFSGIAFVSTAPLREGGRERSCASNLRQIYQALQLYSNDNPGPEQYVGLGQIKFVPGVTTLSPYIKSKSIFFCPNTPPRHNRQLEYWSTYELNFIAVRPSAIAQNQAFFNTFKNDMARLGRKMPLVICNMHDETYYALREQDVDPDLAQPFQIHLLVDGSVEAKRYAAKRHKSFTVN